MIPSRVIILTVICSVQVFANSLPQTQQNAQYVHEKDEQKTETMAEETDTYQLPNDMKSDFQQFGMGSMPYTGWNPYRQADPLRLSRFFNFLSYPNPIFVPYPVIVQPDYIYPYSPAVDEYEDPMSRANGRRPAPFRNSPIYYVRVPPTPYMFVPGLGYTSQPPTFTPNFGPSFAPNFPQNFSPNFSPLMQYNPMSTLPMQPALSSVINLPINFLANGKPTGVYQLDPTRAQPQYQSFLPARPFRPSSFIAQPFTSDSKITHLKRPFVFNGRPEDIFLLQGNYNPLQSMYQQQMPGFY